MAGDIATLRSLITEAISALSGWTVSRFAPELFGRDTDNLSHHAFAVGIPRKVAHDGRQSLTDGTLMDVTVEVRWAHRLRGDAQSDDYDDASDAEQELVKAVVGLGVRHVLIADLQTTASAEGWVTGLSVFTVQLRYALA